MGQDIFYTPEEQYKGMPHATMCGDFMPYYWEGKFYLFFLKAESIYLTATTDFVHFEEATPVVLRGDDTAQDWHVGTGSVCRFEDKFYLFYTGFRKPETVTEKRHEQVLMRAVSDNLRDWKKDASFFMEPDMEHCADGHWRDPDVFWNEELGKYAMVITANEKEGADYRKGCTAVYLSSDMDAWEFYKIIYAPRQFIAHECGNIFHMGDKWYLIFSCFNNWWETKYRYSDNWEGPWIEPAVDDMFDGRQFYAAKTVCDDVHRYIVGWQSVKKDAEDAEKCIWGGTLLAHELVQEKNGELSVKPIDAVRRAFSVKSELLPEPMQGKWKIGDTITGEEQQGFGWCRLGEMKPECMFEADIMWKTGTRTVGVMIHAEDDSLSKWCQLRLECCKNRIIFDRYNRKDGDQSYIEERPVSFKAGKAHIQIFVSGNIVVCYVNGTALSSRCYSTGLGSIGVFVENGIMSIKNFCLWEREN
jgi:beta-fructofuranosidase